MERWIQRYHRRLELGRFLGRATDWLAAFLLVFGAAVLLTKLWLADYWPSVLWLAAVAVPLGLAAGILSRRRGGYSRAESVALLDRKLETGGLLMTLAEHPDDHWSGRLPELETVWRESLPKVRPVRLIKVLALPALFAVGSCFVPLRQAQTEPVLQNTAGRQAVEELDETLDLLEEAEVLEPEQEKQLREEIEKLAEESQESPLTHEKWETVDTLRKELRRQLDTSTLQVSKARDAAAALAEANAPDGESLSEEHLQQLEKSLVETLQTMQKRGRAAKLPPDVRQELKRLTKNGQGRLPKDAGQRQQLLQELQEHLQQESRRLAELRKQSPGGQTGPCPHCGGPQQGGT